MPDDETTPTGPAPRKHKGKKPSASPVPSKQSVIRLALLAAYEEQIVLLQKIAAGEEFEIRTHVTTTAGGGRSKGGPGSRQIKSKLETVTKHTPTLDERLRAMEHLAKFGLGAPNVNLTKDGDDAGPLVITERAE